MIPPTARRLVVVSAVAAVAGLLVVGAVAWIRDLRAGGLTTLTITNEPAKARADGSIAPGFTLPALDGGGTISLSDLRGEVVMLNFWATW